MAVFHHFDLAANFANRVPMKGIAIQGIINAQPPIKMKGGFDPFMFQFKSSNRIEYVHTRDVGLAFSNMAQLLGDGSIQGNKVLNIAGGIKNNCQLTIGELIGNTMAASGLSPVSSDLYGEKDFYTDWLDTEESQKLLRYQRFGIEEFLRNVQEELGWRRFVVKLLSPIIHGVLKRKIRQFHAV